MRVPSMKTLLLSLSLSMLLLSSAARAELVPVDSLRAPAAITAAPMPPLPPPPAPSSAASAKPDYADTAACAKMRLAAVYAAQKAHQAERGTFAETFNEIGYEPAADLCQKAWTLSLRAFNGGKEFRGEAIHPRTGEIWTINQAKKLTRERAAR